jgi:hypothetical protein
MTEAFEHLSELEAMGRADQAVQAVADEDARGRIVDWLMAKYRRGARTPSKSPATNPSSAGLQGANQPRVLEDEIEGIAKKTPNGALVLTIRDLKAKSANDAAVRLAHVLLWAAGELLDADSLSSRRDIVPHLKRWRLYDGNTRKALAAEKGLVRSGDLISLDVHARRLAENYVTEILNPDITGKWEASRARRRARPSKGGQIGD